MAANLKRKYSASGRLTGLSVPEKISRSEKRKAQFEADLEKRRQELTKDKPELTEVQLILFAMVFCVF